MIRAIVAGVLTRTEERLSKAGKPYVLATVREGSGDKTRWVSAFIFADEARETLSAMATADAIAVAGEIDCEIYAPEGAPPRISWSVRADAVMSTNSGARKRSVIEPEQPREGPDDPIPF